MTLHLPRVCHVGLRGPDVKAYSRTYRRLGIRVRPVTSSFGVHMHDNTVEYQRRHKLRRTGTVNQETWDHLHYRFDGYDRWLIEQAIKRFDEPSPRELVVGAFVAMLGCAPFPYMRVRPYEFSIAAVDRDGSDCSGTFHTAYYIAHMHDHSVPDPSGFGFDGYGNTDTMLQHGRRVAEPRLGDACFFYADYGHVGGYLGQGRVFSHGGPGDPHVVSSSYCTMFRSYLP